MENFIPIAYFSTCVIDSPHTCCNNLQSDLPSWKICIGETFMTFLGSSWKVKTHFLKEKVWCTTKSKGFKWRSGSCWWYDSHNASTPLINSIWVWSKGTVVQQQNPMVKLWQTTGIGMLMFDSFLRSFGIGINSSMYWDQKVHLRRVFLWKNERSMRGFVSFSVQLVTTQYF